MAGKVGSSAGAALYRHLLTYQIYGANTEVGKTICSTILSRAFSHEHPTFYLKPVSTGPLTEADDFHVKKFAKDVGSKCLWQFGEPVSPHIAAGQGRRDLEPVWSISNLLFKMTKTHHFIASIRHFHRWSCSGAHQTLF